MKLEKMGPFISELRKKKGITQKELADKLNVTQSCIHKWEKGLSYPELLKIESLSDALDVSVNDLLNGESPCP